MKNLIIFILFINGAMVFAADTPTIDIKSFAYTGQHTVAAEICGQITGATGDRSFAIKILVDEESSAPATYYTQSGTTGSFCLVVASYRGTATASTEIAGKQEIHSKLTQAKLAR